MLQPNARLLCSRNSVSGAAAVRSWLYRSAVLGGSTGAFVRCVHTKTIAGVGTDAKSSSIADPPTQLEPGDRVVNLQASPQAMEEMEVLKRAHAVPAFGGNEAVNVSRIMQSPAFQRVIRETQNETAAFLPLTPFIIKATSMAAITHPHFNAHSSRLAVKLTLKASHNVGILIDTPNGLLTLVMRDVERKSVREVSRELQRLIDEAESRAIPTEDTNDATISLTMAGGQGMFFAQRTVIPPQVAIGAVGRVHTLPKFAPNGTITAQNLVNVSWTADHRIIDGAMLARFTRTFASYMSRPSLMMLDMV